MVFNPDSNKVEDIADTLRQLLADELGTFQNGRKAVWIENDEAPANGEGLHVFLHPLSEQYTQDLYQVCITLRQHDKTRTGSLALGAALDKLRYWFPMNREVQLPRTSEGYLQARFDVRFNKAAYPL